MSKYEDYNNVAKNYDSQRFAMGADVIAAMIQFHCGKPLKDLHVLDAGCGTGNYAKALLDFGVGHVTLLDASSGMLDKAKEKLTSEIASGKVKAVVEASMPPLPFPDASFDVVMFNLVLHHLEHEPDGVHFPQIEKVLKEARRVLKSGGVLSITSGALPSFYENIWFVHLNKDIAKRHIKQYPHNRQWYDIFGRTGFQCTGYMVLNTLLSENIYTALLDPEGPAKKEWRSCNSYWASATEEELKEIEKKIAKMKAEGTLEQFVHQYDTSDGFYAVPLFLAKTI